MSKICAKYIPLNDGNRIYARISGKKKCPAIVLVHGVLVSGAVWSCTQRLLTKAGYFVIAFDLPGHGHSNPYTLPALPPPTAPIPPLVQYEADVILEATRKIIGERSFILVGNSFGGFIAQVLALQHPEALKDLILVDTSPKFSPDPSGFWQPPKYTAQPSIVPVFFALTLGTEDVRRTILQVDVATSFPLATFSAQQQQIYINQYLQMLAQLNQDIGVLEILSLAVGDIRGLISGITVRTLVINGGVIRIQDGLVYGDTIAPWGASQFINEQIPFSQLVIFSNLGHTPQTQDPRRLTAEILTWLCLDRPIKPCIPLQGV